MRGLILVLLLLVILLTVVFVLYDFSEHYTNTKNTKNTKNKWITCPSKEKTCANSMKSHWSCDKKTDCPNPGNGYDHNCINKICMRWKPETYDTTKRLENNNLYIALKIAENSKITGCEKVKEMVTKGFLTIYKNISGKEYKGKIDCSKEIGALLGSEFIPFFIEALTISLKKNNKEDIVSLWIIFNTGVLNSLDKSNKRIISATYNSLGEIDKMTYKLNDLFLSPAVFIQSLGNMEMPIDDTSKKLMKEVSLNKSVIENLKKDYDPYMSFETVSHLILYQISKLGGFYM